jgi:hypothetical protein
MHHQRPGSAECVTAELAQDQPEKIETFVIMTKMM